MEVTDKIGDIEIYRTNQGEENRGTWYSVLNARVSNQNPSYIVSFTEPGDFIIY